MNIEEKYAKLFSELGDMAKRRSDAGIYPALGLTSNLDLLCSFDGKMFSALLERYLPDGKLEEMRPAPMIRTMEELLETVVYYCRSGIGGEADIENAGMIRDTFVCRNGMGGTAVQAAMALQRIGCPSIVHLSDDSEEVCGLLNLPGIYAVSKEGELIPTGQFAPRQEQEIHGIVQFQKGDVIRLGNQEIEIPLSNRLILTELTVNETVPLYEPYFRYIADHGGQISSYVLSGFNCFSSKELLLRRIEYLKKNMEEYRKANPEGITFFEDSHYHDKGIRDACMDALCPCVDVLSLNEEELGYAVKNCGVLLDLDDISSCVEGAESLRKRFRIRKGVLIHTKDYSMYVGDPLGADIETGLICGNLLATAKAMNGWYGTLEQIRELERYPFSEKGLRFRAQAAKAPWADRVTVAPTRYCDRPPYTIGLGDSFVAGVQMCFGLERTKNENNGSKLWT